MYQSICIRNNRIFLNMSKIHANYQKVNFLIDYSNFKYRDYHVRSFSTNKMIFERHKTFDFLGKVTDFLNENDLYFIYLLNYCFILEVLIV